jgi:hypothetical protein
LKLKSPSGSAAFSSASERHISLTIDDNQENVPKVDVSTLIKD